MADTRREPKPELMNEGSVTHPGVVTATPAPALDALQTAVRRALERMEGETAARWMNEQFNDGARAAAAVLREELRARGITL